jgi:hypothetical protein
VSPAVIEKIKKLLRLGQSSNPYEAALAMQRAFDLAQSHGVDVESLDLDEQMERMVHEYMRCPRERISRLRAGVLGVVMMYFRVNVVVGCSKGAAFIGRKSDVEIAGYVYEFLMWAGAKSLRDYCAVEKRSGRRVTSGKKANFTAGFLYGIHSNLKPRNEAVTLEDSAQALVASEGAAREAYIVAELGRTQDRKRLPAPKRNQTALDAGWAEGMATTINQPLKGERGGILAIE